jgi:hypothetical protein
MAKVWMNPWECASGELPPCCIVCGCEDDVEYLERQLEYRPNWPLALLPFHFIGWHLIGGALGWFGERHNQVILTKFPYCYEHYDYWHRRDRWQHVGALTLALGWLVPCLVTFALNNNMRLSPRAIAIVATASAIGLAMILWGGFRIVHVAGMKKARVRMANVHRDFADVVERWQDERSDAE